MNSTLLPRQHSGKLILVFVLLVLQILGLEIIRSAAHEAGGGFMVHIGRPGEGETLYYGPTTIPYGIQVTGWITGYTGNFGDIHLQLEMKAAGHPTSVLHTNAKPDGLFDFLMTVNPESLLLDEGFKDTNFLRCSIGCHLANTTGLPPGKVLLRVTAEDAQGNRSSAERNIIVDRGEFVDIPFEVVLDNEAHEQAGKGIPVRASTLLYMWRARNWTAETDSDGKGLVKVEALTEVATHYFLAVDPVVVDGVLYESPAPVRIDIPPGAREMPQVRLAVKTRQGKITGSLESPGGAFASTFPIRAIRALSGESIAVQTLADGSFHFPDLPIDRYVITADERALAGSGLQVEEQWVDLNTQYETEIRLQMRELGDHVLGGKVLQEDGQPIPFAWVVGESPETLKSVNPEDGSYNFFKLPPGASTVNFTAPGYFSQAHRIGDHAGEVNLDVRMVRRPDTHSLSWGSGEIVIPPETIASVDGNKISLAKGWLWGKGDQQEWNLHIDQVRVLIRQGRFALERRDEKEAWFYLLEGEARLQWSDVGDEKAILAGQMVALGNLKPNPVPFEPVIFSAFHRFTTTPVKETWQPALKAQIRDRLARAGINLAQAITFVTYFSGFLSVVITPFVILYWWNKRTKPLPNLTKQPGPKELK